MALVVDIFNQNAFTAIDFQEQVVERTDFKPQLLGTMDLFDPIYSRSQMIGIADRNGVLTLIPTSELGAPLEELIPRGANVRAMRAVRLAKGSTIYVSEISAVLALPFDDQFRDITQEVTDRNAQITDDMELTWEHMRFGAIQGIVLDADGSTVLVNWYDFWGVAQPGVIDFELDDPDTDVRAKCRNVQRAMQKASKGCWTPSTRIGALVGDTFFDLLVNHPQIKETKVNTNRAPMLENIEGYSSIEIENITFINYRGTDDGSTIAIATDEAKFFPIGARGAFQVGWAPASEFKAGLNKRGQPLYGMILEDKSGRDEWDRIEQYSYPLFICTRPEMLQRAVASSG
jgi:hypothetical protein